MKTMLNKLFLLMLLSGFAFAQGEINLTLLSNFDPYPSIGYNDCWGYTAPDGKEYAFLGVLNGTSVVNISDPLNPVEVGFVPSNTSTWKDIKTYDHYAYVVIDASGNGLQVIDLSDLPNSVSLVNTFTGGGFASSHNIFIDENNAILYAQGGGGARVISLADPANPVQLTTISAPSVHDVFATGDRLYVSEGWQFSYSIWDVSDPTIPALLGRFNTPSSGYAHNAWATDDGNYLMTTEEVPAGKTVKLWDVQDPQNATLMDDYIATATSRPHNVHIKGQYAYLAHYWDGLRILDISDPSNILEVASYDTYPGVGSNYEGNWGAFPYFNSGKVLASDRTYGLFIFYFDGANITGLDDPPAQNLPSEFQLAQNYPNPFNPATSIEYNLPESGEVMLDIFDITGKKVRTLVNQRQTAGSQYRIVWDATDENGKAVSSGIYFYRLQVWGETASFSQTKRMVYMR